MADPPRWAVATWRWAAATWREAAATWLGGRARPHGCLVGGTLLHAFPAQFDSFLEAGIEVKAAPLESRLAGVSRTSTSGWSRSRQSSPGSRHPRHTACSASAHRGAPRTGWDSRWQLPRAVRPLSLRSQGPSHLRTNGRVRCVHDRSQCRGRLRFLVPPARARRSRGERERHGLHPHDPHWSQRSPGIDSAALVPGTVAGQHLGGAAGPCNGPATGEQRPRHRLPTPQPPVIPGIGDDDGCLIR